MLARILTPAGILCVSAACGGQAGAPQTVGPEVAVMTLQPQRVLIGTGLNAGERIVIRGFQRVRPGITVTPAPSPANPPKAAGKPGGVVAATSGLRVGGG
jgi:hypothetical protein